VLLIAGRRFLAPSQNRAILADPNFDQIGEVLASNRKRLDHSPLTELRKQARREALASSARFHAELGAIVPQSSDDRPLIVAGHQPDFFHPGVWIKNFALFGLARQHNLTPFNLIVDNDTAKSTSLMLPIREGESPRDVRLRTVPYDVFAGEVPFEERGVLDESLFASLPERVEPLIRDWSERPLLFDLWPKLLQVPQPLLGMRAVRARWMLEHSWGVHNSELPLSRVCESPSFVRFATMILSDLPQFAESYNSAVREYRELHGIRSRNHPVPDLVQDGERIEAPFWIWHTGDARRGRLFVRRIGECLELSGAGEPIHWNPKSEQFPDGVKIRSRALITTLFARLVLADLFIHGIGGGKYDEVTDALIGRYFQMQPPTFMVLSATLHLPITNYPHSQSDVKELEHRQRDIYWNPQRHLPSSSEVVSLLARKQELTNVEPMDKVGRKLRFRQLQEVTQALRGYAQSALDEIEGRLDFITAEADANALFRRRDFSFLLYPESTIRPFMMQSAFRQIDD